MKNTIASIAMLFVMLNTSHTDTQTALSAATRRRYPLKCFWFPRYRRSDWQPRVTRATHATCRVVESFAKWQSLQGKQIFSCEAHTCCCCVMAWLKLSHHAHCCCWANSVSSANPATINSPRQRACMECKMTGVVLTIPQSHTQRCGQRFGQRNGFKGSDCGFPCLGTQSSDAKTADDFGRLRREVEAPWSAETNLSRWGTDVSSTETATPSEISELNKQK